MNRSFSLYDEIRNTIKPAHPQVVAGMAEAFRSEQVRLLMQAQDLVGQPGAYEALIQAQVIEQLAEVFKEAAQ